MAKTAAKLTFIILIFKVTFINKSYGDTKRRCVIQNHTQAWSKFPVTFPISKSTWIKTTSSGLSYKLRVNGEKN